MLARVLVKGGVISTGKFLQIMEIAKKAGNTAVHLGSRQDIIFHISDRSDIDEMCQAGEIQMVAVAESTAHESQNVVSSIVSCDLGKSTSWIHEGTYLQILESLGARHTLKINVTDPMQPLVPALSGDLNFVASRHEKYWFLFIRFPHSEKSVEWPALVHSRDVSSVSKEIESALENHAPMDLLALFAHVNTRVQPENRMKDHSVEFPAYTSPAYEGINNMRGKDRLWAGFYWRNNSYDIEFLERIAGLCERTRNTRLFFTPWKSFLVKDIDPADILKWEIVIGRHGITMRHAAADLNWHIPLLDHRAQKLKTYIVRELDKRDIRTEGMTFSIQSKPANPFTTILIEPQNGLRTRYRILYARDFNPNSNTYIEFDRDLFRSRLVHSIDFLCRRFYDEMPDTPAEQRIPSVTNRDTDNHYVYQCSHCKTVYDANIGSVFNGIPRGVDFDELPDTFVCSTCESPKADFTFVMAADL